MSNAANDMAHVSHTDVCARFSPGPVQQRGSVISVIRGWEGMQGEDHKTRACTRSTEWDPQSTRHKATTWDHCDKTSRLTDPPPKPKDSRTGVRLRVRSQEPFGVKLHRIGVASRVVQNPPVRQVKSWRRGRSDWKRTSREKFLFPATHQMFASTVDPLGMK